jgi:hypothetical protein
VWAVGVAIGAALLMMAAGATARTGAEIGGKIAATSAASTAHPMDAVLDTMLRSGARPAAAAPAAGAPAANATDQRQIGAAIVGNTPYRLSQSASSVREMALKSLIAVMVVGCAAFAFGGTEASAFGAKATAQTTRCGSSVGRGRGGVTWRPTTKRTAIIDAMSIDAMSGAMEDMSGRAAVAFAGRRESQRAIASASVSRLLTARQ